MIVNETKVSHLLGGVSMPGSGYTLHTGGDQEICQAHTGCWVCGCRDSLQLGLGGEAGLCVI